MELHEIVLGWATVGATLAGALLVWAGLIDTARARKEQNTILRKTETLRMLVETLQQRSVAGVALPLDRDREAIAATIKAAAHEGPDAEKTAAAIRQYLNYWETLSGGVLDGVLDEELLRRRARGRVVAVWTNYHPFIEQRRVAAGSDSLWADLETLGRRWAAKELA